jgi:hypothetical protein
LISASSPFRARAHSYGPAHALQNTTGKLGREVEEEWGPARQRIPERSPVLSSPLHLKPVRGVGRRRRPSDRPPLPSPPPTMRLPGGARLALLLARRSLSSAASSSARPSLYASRAHRGESCLPIPRILLAATRSDLPLTDGWIFCVQRDGATRRPPGGRPSPRLAPTPGSSTVRISWLKFVSGLASLP